jgi:hypothetical protein
MQLTAAPSPIPIHVNPSTGEITASTGEQQPREAPLPPRAFSTPSYSAAALPTRLVIATGGEYARLSRRKFGPPERREWRRGSISDFTPRSRSRMLQSLAKIDRRAVSNDGLFVTLTYPREWPPTTRACKAHLEAFRKRVERLWPDAWFYWKLEYQRRGAEHFHLLMFNVPTCNPEWFHDTWHDIVKLGNHWHEEYGADVKRMDNWKQAGAYCAKYCAKVEERPMNPEPGRFWGVATRRNRVETIQEAKITEEEFYLVRRLFRRLIRAPKGYDVRGGPTSGVWVRCTNETAKRALEWAASARDGPTQTGLYHAHGDTAAVGRHVPGIGWSNTGGSCVRAGTKSDHTSGSARLPLFDSADLARARALKH